jgi:hypothetical protein
MSKPAKQPPRAKKYASYVKETGLTRQNFAAVVGVRPECITRRCSGEEVFREEAMIAAKYLAMGGLV